MGKKADLPTFALKDTVTWSSQAGGRTKKKVATVVLVVPARRDPLSVIEEHNRELSPEDRIPRLKEPGFPREHESYIVKTDRARSDKGSQPYYWPPVAKLTKYVEASK